MRLETTPFPMFVIWALVCVMVVGGGLGHDACKGFYRNYIVIRLDTINYAALALYFI